MVENNSKYSVVFDNPPDLIEFQKDRLRLHVLEHLFEAVNVDPVRILQQTVCYDSSKMLPEALLGKPICEHKRKPGFESASKPEAEADA
ncbi:hypothetical protein ACFX1X_047795 [Malus domestica]